MTADERAEVERLQRENVELKRFSEICARRGRLSHRRDSTAERSGGRVCRPAPRRLRSPAALRRAARSLPRRSSVTTISAARMVALRQRLSACGSQTSRLWASEGLATAAARGLDGRAGAPSSG